MSIPSCIKCHSVYVYEDQEMLVCPECAYEWNPSEILTRWRYISG